LRIELRLPSIKPEIWLTTMMADDQDADRIFVNQTKQNRIRETMRETPAYTMLDDRILQGIGKNTLDGRIYLRSKLVAEAGTLPVVVRHSIVEL